MEESPAHTPDTESEFLLTLIDSCFVFVEENSLPPLIPPESSSSASDLLIPSLSQLLSNRLTKAHCPSSVPLSLLSLFSSLRPFWLPNLCCLPSAPLFLICPLSVARILGPSVHQLHLEVGSPRLRLRPLIPSLHFGPSP